MAHCSRRERLGDWKLNAPSAAPHGIQRRVTGTRTGHELASGAHETKTTARATIRFLRSGNEMDDYEPEPGSEIESDSETEWGSGPFCQHWGSLGECSQKCKCGHSCREHWGCGDDDCRECDCQKYEEAEL